MLKKEQIYATLKKYGFYSANRTPYLCELKNQTGLYFSWQSKHFGTLNRVLTFDTIEALEEEVFKYWWYLKNKSKVDIDIVFDDYETLSPKVSYVVLNTPLSMEGMKKFNAKSCEKQNVVDINKRQLLRTCSILITILKNKVATANLISTQVSELKQQYITLSKKLSKKLDGKTELEDNNENYDILKTEYNAFNGLIIDLEDEYNTLDTVNKMNVFILKLLEVMKRLEEDETRISNVYLLQRFPYEINDIKEKIKALDEALNNKKTLFKSKANQKEILAKVDAKSECKKMININLYLDKERKNIENKYKNYDNVELIQLGDYINDFDKLNIELPEFIKDPEQVAKYDENCIIADLQNQFEKLSKKEKSACFIASSFLRKNLNILTTLNVKDILDVNTIIEKLTEHRQLNLFQEAYRILDNYNSTKIRIKYFHIIKMTDFKSFLLSLVNVLDILNTIHFNLNGYFYGYFNDCNDNIINVYLKNIFSLKGDTTYISKIGANTSIYYSPISIRKELDIIDTDELIVKENSNLFILKEKVNIHKPKNPLCVNQYEKGKCSYKNNYVIIGEVLLKNIYKYYNCDITAKES